MEQCNYGAYALMAAYPQSLNITKLLFREI